MTVQERHEAMKRRDVKRMTKAELEALAAMLRLTAQSLDEAIKYERTSARHPAALRHEEFAEAQLDATILYFAKIRSRADLGPTMNAAGEIYQTPVPEVGEAD